MNRRTPLIVAAFACFLAILILGGVAWRMVDAARTPAPVVTAATSTPIGGSFQLTDHTGRAVTDADYRGRFQIVYFGFTYCPDVCPTDLSQIALAVEQLGDDADKVQPLFVTIDPERDTPEQLANYVPAFGDRLVGLTGTPEQIADIAGKYRAYFAKNGDGADYMMNHSAFIYLMDPEGGFIDVIPHGTSADDIAAKLRHAIERHA